MQKKETDAELIGSILSELKDFQRDTVEHVHKQFYEKQTKRFLVADEVGLGKTHVARGVIAKSIELWESQRGRVDIIYVCSNVAIAKQNAERLDITRDIVKESDVKSSKSHRFLISTRLTLLAIEIDNSRKENFICLTPNTAFNFKSSSLGTVRERALIFHILRGISGLQKSIKGTWIKTLSKILQYIVSDKSWSYNLKEIERETLDPRISESFEQIVLEKEFYKEIELCCEMFARKSSGEIDKENEREKVKMRRKLIQKLRENLAIASLEVLNPKLIILDEFQRYRELLKEVSNEKSLAHILFNRSDTKTLLLSATPYQMLPYESEIKKEDQHGKFIELLEFLFQCTENESLPQSSEKVENIKVLLSKYRNELGLWARGENIKSDVKKELRSELLQVMCRTERVRFTESGDAMLRESPRFENLSLSHSELEQIMIIEEIAGLVGAGNQIEYWKSVPYLLSYMRGYKLRNKIEKCPESKSEDLIQLIKSAKEHMIKPNEIKNFMPLSDSNAKTGKLLDETVNKKMWKLLWMPPSMRYIKPTGEFEELKDLTKSLIFSAWHATPTAIATICSYEAERNMVLRKKKDKTYNVIGKEIFTPRLNYEKKPNKSKIPTTSFPVLSWMLPSLTLARSIDPLKIVLDNGGKPLDKSKLRSEVIKQCRDLISGLPVTKETEYPDRKWYWAVPLLLDIGGEFDKVNEFRNWLECPYTQRAVERSRRISENSKKKQSAGIKYEFDLLKRMANGDIQLGRKPKNLSQVVCDFALASPGTCALRALMRIIPDFKIDEISKSLLNAAIEIANGFRTLYNLPYSVAMLKTSGEYWRTTLKYGINGNIQSVLDEYVHTLSESITSRRNKDELVTKIGNHIHSVLTHKSTRLSADEINLTKKGYTEKPVKIKCQFAQRFGGAHESNEEKRNHIDTVREAFNSPFQPFILASTSIGQEGLDFHTYCHSVMHWNLPSNPVELEQREGRVHRYKGHVVRKNVAEKYGLDRLSQKELKCENGFFDKDPWKLLFKIASDENSSDLETFWVFDKGDDSAKIERQVPILSFSKEVEKLERLKINLALYRLVFGQPRRDELLKYLRKQIGSEGKFSIDEINKMQISLKPESYKK